MAYSISAAVGDSKSKSPKPANKKKDVELVQLMLLANGYPLPITGSVDSATLNCITAFQRKGGKIKQPDGVIQPGDATWKAGLPKLTRRAKELESFEAYEVVENGKKKLITVQEFIRIEEETKSRILRRARSMSCDAENIYDLIREMHSAADGSQGYVNAFVSLGIRMAKNIEIPSDSAALDAKAAADLIIAYADRSKPDWAKVNAQHKKAVELLNKAKKEWAAYEKKFVSGAEAGLMGATITRDVSFAVLEVLATGYLVTTRGMPLTQANALAAAGCEGLKTGAGEVGEYAANDTFDPKGSARRIIGNTAIAGAAALVGGKLTGPVMKKIAGKLGEQFARRVSARAANYAWPFVEKVIDSQVGQALIENATKETIKLFQKPISEGKMPSEQDIVNGAINVLTGSFFKCAPVKAFADFDANWPKKALFELSDSYARPAVKAIKLQMVKHYPTDAVNALISKGGKDIINEVSTKLLESATTIGMQAAYGGATGTETKEADFRKRAAAAVQTDARLGREFEAAVLAEAERRLKKMEKAR
ncbi:peptidoglycan-binding domain-containing protein [Seohaeicola nanhaiensis]|uniref:Peptidoglycan-binding domain-containing protein n=1 Tax=Seohaeicola nanhaiensis TaxID=1387282 RepID=A0ABV9KIF4_9RHOB